MPRSVTYRIIDRPDGLFSVVATLAPDRTYRRDGFATLAEVEEWVEGLRVLMAACGAPVAEAAPPAGLAASGEPEDTDGAGSGRPPQQSFIR